MKNNEKPSRNDIDICKKILIDFIFFVTKTEEINPLIAEGIPIRRRQKFMRELQIVDTICSILQQAFYTIKGNPVYDIEKINQQDPFIRIGQLSYRLLKHIVKGYRANEMYAS